jgi:RNA polymerase sigma factor (sigma-70 family)
MSEADQHLLQLIRAGDHDGWSQFVARFQGRLIAYATRQVGQTATAEDLVQETFVAFLKYINDYREECELESFLFQILRRRIVDHYRRQGRNKEVPACSFNASESPEIVQDPLQHAVAQDMHASWYARRSEARDGNERNLAAAVRALAAKLRAGEKFRDLKIAEGLFYAGRRNRELAEVLGTSENEISQVKYRLVKRLAQLVKDAGGTAADGCFSDESSSHMLTSVWESQRPSCPKRTTLGKFVLGILPADWDEFVDFHVNTLGCTFCSANLVELNSPSEADSANERLFSSTVGFLKT